MTVDRDSITGMVVNVQDNQITMNRGKAKAYCFSQW